jgi:enamine deaminase RidA (YjgF/YER057c/UK114 family)
MKQTRRVDAKTPWGDAVGYSRAVRTGNVIAVSGTASSDRDGRIVGKGDAYAQATYIIQKIEYSLRELDAGLQDVIRTRIYTTDISRWKEIARAHREHFGQTKPATSMIEVARLIDPDMLVEIEAEAFTQ